MTSELRSKSSLWEFLTCFNLDSGIVAKSYNPLGLPQDLSCWPLTHSALVSLLIFLYFCPQTLKYSTIFKVYTLHNVSICSNLIRQINQATFYKAPINSYWTLSEKIDDPTVDEVIEIFQIFTQGSIKRYLFKSIKENLKLELALSIVQDPISNSPGRAKSLELKVVKLVNKDQTKVDVCDGFESPAAVSISADDFPLIWDTSF